LSKQLLGELSKNVFSYILLLLQAPWNDREAMLIDARMNFELRSRAISAEI
jgi:hypothetical protein